MARGYHTAAELINEALATVRDFHRTREKEAGMYFLSGWRDFSLYRSSAQVKEAWRPITAINTVSFPEDLVRLIDVGVVIDGEFFSFTKADNIVDAISDPLDLELDEDRGEDETIRRSPTVGYGAKANNLEYYYKEDRVRRRIRLSRMALDTTIYANRSEVLIKYVPNGIDDFNSTYVPDDAANLLVSYISYKLVLSMPEKYNANHIAMRKQEYLEQVRMYEALELPSLQELEDMIYETSGQNVRR